MSDKNQIVIWSLGQSCFLRPQGEILSELLSKARMYSNCASKPDGEFGFHDGICVFSYTLGRVESDTPFSYHIPSQGFEADNEFEAIGGIQGLHQMCSDCAANAELEGVAGCAGVLAQFAYSHELDVELQRLAEKLNLKAALDQAI